MKIPLLLSSIPLLLSTGVTILQAADIEDSDVVTARYGPDDCVSLSISRQGSCVIATDCGSQDLSQVEFAFDCQVPQDGGIVRHSFGLGGFDASEEFDTAVSCDVCTPPATFGGELKNLIRTTDGAMRQNRRTSLLRLGRPSATTKAAQSEYSQEDAVVRFGPSKCVSTFRRGEHCIIQTECNNVDLSNYEFGLICINSGKPVRHLFGRDSFDPEETFDTLIQCEQCLGLEDIPGGVALGGQITQLATEVASLNVAMQNLTVDIARLDDKVFPSVAETAGNGPAAAPSAPVSTTPQAFPVVQVGTPPPKSLLRARSRIRRGRHRTRLRRGKTNHIRYPQKAHNSDSQTNLDSDAAEGDENDDEEIHDIREPLNVDKLRARSQNLKAEMRRVEKDKIRMKRDDDENKHEMEEEASADSDGELVDPEIDPTPEHPETWEGDRAPGEGDEAEVDNDVGDGWLD